MTKIFRVHYDTKETVGHCSIVHALYASDASIELRKRVEGAIIKKVKLDRTGNDKAE